MQPIKFLDTVLVYARAFELWRIPYTGLFILNSANTGNTATRLILFIFTTQDIQTLGSFFGGSKFFFSSN